ncbi:hypothetical protein V8G54_013155 [Vigna mungo]|uniref:Uncharacterized protein n=1 Tax=Vigna mungo TaxID=3915 RepID=A0AAQ3S4N9_VIGMU
MLQEALIEQDERLGNRWSIAGASSLRVSKEKLANRWSIVRAVLFELAEFFSSGEEDGGVEVEGRDNVQQELHEGEEDGRVEVEGDESDGVSKNPIHFDGDIEQERNKFIFIVGVHLVTMVVYMEIVSAWRLERKEDWNNGRLERMIINSTKVVCAKDVDYIRTLAITEVVVPKQPKKLPNNLPKNLPKKEPTGHPRSYSIITTTHPIITIF